MLKKLFHGGKGFKVREVVTVELIAFLEHSSVAAPYVLVHLEIVSNLIPITLLFLSFPLIYIGVFGFSCLFNFF